MALTEQKVCVVCGKSLSKRAQKYCSQACSDKFDRLKRQYKYNEGDIWILNMNTFEWKKEIRK